MIQAKSEPAQDAAPAHERRPADFFRLTLPLLVRTLRFNKLLIFALIVLSIVAGVLPTMKSDLEAAVLDQLVRCIGRNPDMECSLTEPLRRFTSMPAKEGFTETLSRSAFSHLTALQALLVYLMLAAITALVVWCATYLTAKVSAAMFVALRGAGLRKGLATDPSQIPALPNVPGQYATAIQAGANAVGNAYEGVLKTGQDLFLLATVIALVATRNWYFGLFCLGVVLSEVFISTIQARTLRRRREELDRSRNELVARSDDILAKREILAAYEQEERYSGRLDDISRAYADVERKLSVMEALFLGLKNLVSDYGRIVILVGGFAIVALQLVPVGDIGDAYFLISIYTRLLAPTRNIVSRYDDVRRSEATSRLFLDLLRAPTVAPLPPDQNGANGGWTRSVDIKFKDISFRYVPDGKPVLSKCSFTIPAGKATLILGPSGSGKTTIARILLGFWRASEGTIELGGRNHRDYTPQQLRQQMSYVAQADHVIDDTVLDNVMWAATHSDAINRETVANTLRRVGLIKEGDDSILDRPARELSPGMAQRLSVARMLLDASEITILDEPMAGVDVHTMRDLLPLVRRELKERGHTVMVISHRLAFAGYVDHIVVLGEHGSILEEGAPADLLLRADGQFRALYDAARAEIAIMAAK